MDGDGKVTTPVATVDSNEVGMVDCSAMATFTVTADSKRRK